MIFRDKGGEGNPGTDTAKNDFQVEVNILKNFCND